MLLSLMYHHINGDKFSNDLETFHEHLDYLKEHYTFVVPGEKLDKRNNNLCLIFDDAYYDFYHYVFPLLKKHKLKAVLAVPTALISNSTTANINERLSLGHNEIYKHKNYQKFGTFSTWSEIKEMHDSGYVIMASHSHRHKDLSLEDIDLYEEVIESKNILEMKLNTTIDCFILPFGRYNYSSLSLLRKNYRYIFKVGQGINKDFSGINGLIYRIDADNIKSIASLFTPMKMFKYKLKSLLKSFYDGIQKKK